MDDVEPPTLDDQLCFDLYAASRSVISLYRPMLNQIGITYPQYLVLLVLWADRTRTVKELGETLHLDHGTLTPLLRRMETNGLVTRRRGRDDERFVEVALTDKGAALGRHARSIQCSVKDVLGLDDTEFRALQTALRVVTERSLEDSAPRA
jgi:DNA-binding MarR family transcriptional regulator